MSATIKNYGLQEKFLPSNIVPVPVFFIKTPVFTPSSKNVNRMKEIRKVEMENFYGYSKVKIKGLALNLNTDFKVLANLLKIRDEVKTNTIEMSILDFAESMGQKRRSVSKSSKKALEESLERLMGQTITFSREDKNNDLKSIKMANLITNADVCFDSGMLEITFNKEIIEIYKRDKFVQYVNLDTFMMIKGEVAKCLWLFYETNSKFEKFPKENILKRLQLRQKNIKEQNRQIKNAHEELLKMGYLTEVNYDKQGNLYKIKRHKNKR